MTIDRTPKFKAGDRVVWHRLCDRKRGTVIHITNPHIAQVRLDEMGTIMCAASTHLELLDTLDLMAEALDK